jgi:hypothetical protein
MIVFNELDNPVKYPCGCEAYGEKSLVAIFVMCSPACQTLQREKAQGSLLGEMDCGCILREVGEVLYIFYIHDCTEAMHEFVEEGYDA